MHVQSRTFCRSGLSAIYSQATANQLEQQFVFQPLYYVHKKYCIIYERQIIICIPKHYCNNEFITGSKQD